MGSVRNKSLQENDTNLHQAQEASLKNLSEDSKINFKTLSNTSQQMVSSNQDKGLNEPGGLGLLRLHNFIKLSQISEEDKIEIIKTGFQLQVEGKISLKKYYEGTETRRLFQLKGYSIKYETIRRNKLYQTLKK